MLTKLLNIPLAHLQEVRWVTITSYLNDTLLLADSHKETGELAADLFQNLGFMISKDKSVIAPTHTIEYWRFVINSMEMKVTMTRGKCDNIAHIVHEYLGVSHPGR